MATRDSYETGFDEDVQSGSITNPCPECDGHVTTNVKETVCEDCGLVIEEQRLDHGPEWRAYDADERERTGALLTAARHDRGISTEIERGTDANGNELSAQKRQRLARMRHEQTRGRWRSKAEQNLAHGLGEVRRLVSAPDLSRINSRSDVTIFLNCPERGLASRYIHRGSRPDEPLPLRQPTEQARVVPRRSRRTGQRRLSIWVQSRMPSD
jgi:transcription initiation factor TFIIIB Brf1 subunit/transcription initiation factor TFIIB